MPDLQELIALATGYLQGRNQGRMVQHQWGLEAQTEADRQRQLALQERAQREAERAQRESLGLTRQQAEYNMGAENRALARSQTGLAGLLTGLTGQPAEFTYPRPSEVPTPTATPPSAGPSGPIAGPPAPEAFTPGSPPPVTYTPGKQVGQPYAGQTLGELLGIIPRVAPGSTVGFSESGFPTLTMPSTSPHEAAQIGLMGAQKEGLQAGTEQTRQGTLEARLMLPGKLRTQDLENESGRIANEVNSLVLKAKQATSQDEIDEIHLRVRNMRTQYEAFIQTDPSQANTLWAKTQWAILTKAETDIAAVKAETTYRAGPQTTATLAGAATDLARATAIPVEAGATATHAQAALEAVRNPKAPKTPAQTPEEKALARQTTAGSQVTLSVGTDTLTAAHKYVYKVGAGVPTPPQMTARIWAAVIALNKASTAGEISDGAWNALVPALRDRAAAIRQTYPQHFAPNSWDPAARAGAPGVTPGRKTTGAGNQPRGPEF